jgi:hypothetical protein
MRVNPLLKELHARWVQMFSSLAAGDDVPPALQLRTEGLMEAAVILGLAEEAEIQGAMNEQYAATSGRAIEEDFGPQWQALFPFPQIPVVAQRAPVYPSTRD